MKQTEHVQVREKNRIKSEMLPRPSGETCNLKTPSTWKRSEPFP